MKAARLVMVTAENNNKYYNMTEEAGGVIAIEYGRVDKTSTKLTKPISDWDKILRSKLKKGYKDVTHLSVEEEPEQEESSVEDISDRVIHKLFNKLQAYANKTIRENYKISSRKVTQAMINEAQGIVDELANLSKKKDIDVKSFNKSLLDLFHVIPRNMGKVQENLLKNDGLVNRNCSRMVDREQSTLDVMAGQVVVNSKTDDAEKESADTKRNLLDLLGLEVVKANDKEVETVKRKLGRNSGQYKGAYKVINKKTQAIFDKYLSEADNKRTALYWHGSRNENWLNILSTGLLIRPSGAIHTGSMFGDGVYFADKAQKSIGYTSLRGSYWARGGQDTGFIALYTVHTGNRKTITRAAPRLNKKQISSEGYDSVYAKGGADLRNNEYIVYDSRQSTISFLVEISS